MKLPPLVLLPLSLFVAGADAAAPGALEINNDCVAVGCFGGDTPGYPVTITQPGTYVLTSDLAPPQGSQNAIVITATQPVDFDLAGHTIDGGATCTGTPVSSCSAGTGGSAILAQSNPPTSIRIHDGTTRGFINAIAIFYADDGTVLDHMTVTQNSNNGLFVTSETVSAMRVRDSQVTRNGNQGIFASSPIILENSSVAGNHLEGVIAGSSNTILVGNRIGNNGAKGFSCGDPAEVCAMGQNTFVGNNGGGVQFTVTALTDMGGNVCLDHACP